MVRFFDDGGVGGCFGFLRAVVVGGLALCWWWWWVVWRSTTVVSFIKPVSPTITQSSPIVLPSASDMPASHYSCFIAGTQ